MHNVATMTAIMRDKTNDNKTTTNNHNHKKHSSSAIKLFVLTSESNERPSQDITHVCVHSSVNEVFGKEFENLRQLQHLHLCPGVQSIGPKAFQDCSSLKTVSVASTLESIGYRSFYFTSLTQVDLSKGFLQTIGFCAFGHCQLLESVKLPLSLKKIEDWAFSHCHKLQDVHIPNRVETIGRLAFLNCSSLTTIAIPSSVELLGEWCFQDCTSLTSAVMEPTSKRTEIAAGTFANCQALETFKVPAGMQVIGTDAFRDCTSLVSVDVCPDLKYIHAKAFYGCQSLCAMAIPSCTIGIGDRAFYGCANLVGVELLDSQNLQFGSEAFAHCPNLVNIALCPPPDTAIPQDLFSGCAKLRAAEDEPAAAAADDDANPYLPGLQDRFADLPVHEKCYHSSMTMPQELLTEIFRQESSTPEEVEEDEPPTRTVLQDSLGMTPFHLLATGTTQRTDLLEVLLERYPLSDLSCKDSSNKTMMDYLVQDQRPDSLALVQMVLQKTMVDGMTSWGKPSWRSTLDTMIQSLSEHWSNNHHDEATKLLALQKIHAKLESYARCEAMSLLDLAVWKTDMETRCQYEIHRENCRLLCGANIIKAKVFDYLCGNSDDDKIFVATSIFPYDLSWMCDVGESSDAVPPVNEEE